MKRHMLLGVVLAALGTAGVAHADDDDCQVPMDRWQPLDVVHRAVTARGWQVGRIKIDDGCYELKGTDERGASFEVKLDPATLEVVKMKRKDERDGSGRDREDDDDDDDENRDDRDAREEGARSRTSPLTSPPANPTPPGGPLGNGAPPGVVVR